MLKLMGKKIFAKKNVYLNLGTYEFGSPLKIWNYKDFDIFNLLSDYLKTIEHSSLKF